MKIGAYKILEKPLIIAEIGNNHEGKFDVAQELIKKAAECQVDAVKFQTFKTEHYVSQSDVARFNRLKSFELSQSQFIELSELAHSLGLLFISTPFDIQSARFLINIVDAIKIASGDINFYPLIREVAKSDKPLIVSTGASGLSQIQKTFQYIKEIRNNRELDLAFLHCVSSYPVPLEQVNLRSIPYLIKQFDLPIGYSDHTLGIDASIAASILGASIIEKHFTLDKDFSEFRDHQLSADPTEMRELVKKIKSIIPMLGKEDKQAQDSESGMLTLIRRSIASAKDLPKGHALRFEDLTWIRPAGGFNPGDEDRLIGKTLQRDVAFGEILKESDIN